MVNFHNLLEICNCASGLNNSNSSNVDYNYANNLSVCVIVNCTRMIALLAFVLTVVFYACCGLDQVPQRS